VCARARADTGTCMFVTDRNGKLVADSSVSLLATHRSSVLRRS
jgi:hypothetical protein